MNYTVHLRVVHEVHLGEVMNTGVEGVVGHFHSVVLLLLLTARSLLRTANSANSLPGSVQM